MTGARLHLVGLLSHSPALPWSKGLQFSNGATELEPGTDEAATVDRINHSTAAARRLSYCLLICLMAATLSAIVCRLAIGPSMTMPYAQLMPVCWAMWHCITHFSVGLHLIPVRRRMRAAVAAVNAANGRTTATLLDWGDNTQWLLMLWTDGTVAQHTDDDALATPLLNALPVSYGRTLSSHLLPLDTVNRINSAVATVVRRSRALQLCVAMLWLTPLYSVSSTSTTQSDLALAVLGGFLSVLAPLYLVLAIYTQPRSRTALQAALQRENELTMHDTNANSVMYELYSSSSTGGAVLLREASNTLRAVRQR